jgi:short-subunit dehydrogenase
MTFINLGVIEMTKKIAVITSASRGIGKTVAIKKEEAV